METDPIAPWLDRLRGMSRRLHAQMCLQEACNRLPPGDLTRLYLRLRDPEFAWLHPHLGDVAPYFGFMTARPRRKALHRPQLAELAPIGQVARYETPGVAPGDKRLYIFFSGRGGQFFVPFSMLLYLLPPGPKDVLSVRANMAGFFLDGIEGLGRTIPEICDTLRTRFATGAYRHVTVAGFSTSGYHAVQVADGIGADLGVTFAARLPFAALRLKRYQEAGVPAYCGLCACSSQRAGRLVNVLPVKVEWDVAASRRIKAARPELIQFHMILRRNHNILAVLTRARTIRPFMRMVFAENATILRLLAPISTGIGTSIRWLRFRLGTQVLRKPL